jgi:hypothetical protein
MFVWENSGGQKREKMDPLEKEPGYLHEAFRIPGSSSDSATVTGVCQSHHHITRVRTSETPNLSPKPEGGEERLMKRSEEEEGEVSPLRDAESSSWSPFACRKDFIPTERIFWDQVCLSLSAPLTLPTPPSPSMTRGPSRSQRSQTQRIPRAVSVSVKDFRSRARESPHSPGQRSCGDSFTRMVRAALPPPLPSYSNSPLSPSLSRDPELLDSNTGSG